MVANGTLRSDLYFRLNVLSLKLPPLRERVDDIVLLGESFGEQIARRYGIGAFQLSPAARQCLQNYSWPGNVRELRHVIERATLLSGDGTVTEEALALPSTDANSAALNEFFNLTLDEAERLLIIEALKRSGDNISAAARRLGITRMAMRYRMKKHRFA